MTVKGANGLQELQNVVIQQPSITGDGGGSNGGNGGSTFNATKRGPNTARGDRQILKNRYYVLLAFAILLPLAAAAVSIGPVYGQNCSLQVGSMGATTQNSGSYYGSSYPYNIQLTVPMTMSCNAGPQVWATGTAYDTVANANLGTNYVTMSSNNGQYSGQLVFNLPSSVVQHQLQVQIQVYNGYNNGQYSGLVASSSPTVTVNPTGSSYSYYNGYPTGCYNGYYYYSYSGYYYYGYPYSYSCSSSYSYPYYYYYYSYPYYYHYGYSWGYHHH